MGMCIFPVFRTYSLYFPDAHEIYYKYSKYIHTPTRMYSQERWNVPEHIPNVQNILNAFQIYYTYSYTQSSLRSTFCESSSVFPISFYPPSSLRSTFCESSPGFPISFYTQSSLRSTFCESSSGFPISFCTHFSTVALSANRAQDSPFLPTHSRPV